MAPLNSALQATGLEAFDWTGLGKELGLGAVLGFAIGFAAKKAMKLALIIAALLLLLAVALETQGLITIHWGALEAAYAEKVRPDNLAGAVQRMMHTIGQALPATSGFALGCVLGFKKG